MKKNILTASFVDLNLVAAPGRFTFLQSQRNSNIINLNYGKKFHKSIGNFSYKHGDNYVITVPTQFYT